jgi:hypothetical protein
MEPDFDIHCDFASDDVQIIMIYLAYTAMRRTGYRYGAFLESASNAAKVAIYITYLESEMSFRGLSHLFHIESNRVRSILEESKQLLEEMRCSREGASFDPYHLIQLPYLWLERYPISSNQLIFSELSINEQQQKRLMKRLPHGKLRAKVVSEVQLYEMLHDLQNRVNQEQISRSSTALSEAFTQHLLYCLLHSGTIIRLGSVDGVRYYALTRSCYSPFGERERSTSMLRDTRNFITLMKHWITRENNAMRIVEELCISPERVSDAQSELDILIRNWADKYHEDGQLAITLTAVVGSLQSNTD